MNLKTLKTFGAASLIALGAVGATAALADKHSDAGDKPEIQAFLAAPGSITDAEKDTGGKAMSVEFETDDTATGVYEVEVAMPDGTTKTVAVNPADGSVTAVAMDDDDDKN
ncbi:PepSY domain-containing protein [Oceaniovalibus sp. ACAM 378]|uniref:PepSY domain-containing protein n=1 Tax=Oceaniovalibus sp. ACAM 378 TaxID=2599923 RepID=UPI0011D4BA3E|nr:PepSY domain-containing protein [Oceaniovalibus sp. ACAM 378]TYB89068.1 PepSY domain-containing protein [Oceaniovalibus sp. ACAM 378]